MDSLPMQYNSATAYEVFTANPVTSVSAEAPRHNLVFQLWSPGGFQSPVHEWN